MTVNSDELLLPVQRRVFLKNAACISLGIPILGQVSQWKWNRSGGNPGRSSGEFVPVMLTPYLPDYEIDFEGLDRLTDFYFRAGAEGYFANCLSSEMYSLSDPERLAITRRVIQYLSGRSKVVATGSFGETIDEMSDFVKKIYDTGVDSVILVTGHLAGREEGDEVFIRNVEKLMAQTGNIPLGTYESPNPYKRVLSPEVYSFLRDTGRFFYHKDTSEDIDGISVKLEISADSDFELYNAHTGSAVASLRKGAAGMSPISGNFYPEIIHWVCKHATDMEKKEDAEWIQEELIATEKIISRGYPNSAKYFLRKRGLDIQVLSRTSKNVLPEEYRNDLDQVYERFLGWCERLDIIPV